MIQKTSNKKDSDLEALPRYVYGITTVVTVLALLLVAYVYAQNEQVLRFEQQLTTYHLPTIVALNTIDHELGEIEKHLIRAGLPASSMAGPPDVQQQGAVSRSQPASHLHLINSRLDVIQNRQPDKPDIPGIVFEASTAHLQDSIRKLERMIGEPRAPGAGESDGNPARALKHAQNRVEQLKRLHLKETANIGRQLSQIEQSKASNIAGSVALALLLGVMVVGRLLFLIRRSLANKRKAVSELQAYRDHLEKLVAERSRELEASNRELESYSYSIAHDLRAPLRTVTSFSQILQEDASLKLNSEERQSLERVIKAGKHMAQLIDDILELSRISRAELERNDIDLSRLARDVASRLDETHPDRQVQWRVQEGLKVRGSRLLMEVCLDNLFNNAWKYTSKVDSACIEFGTVKQDDETVYFVRDNGIGFDMQYADNVFKPFQRLEKSEDYPGTGVGLATVERVIRRHGGRIWVSSEQGKGATFQFILPS